VGLENSTLSESDLEALLLADYNAKAYLQLELASNVALYSYAIWDVFQPGYVSTYLTNASAGGFLSQVESAVTDARNKALPNEAQLENLTIYTPVIGSQSSGYGIPQDFDTVPDASSLPALALDLFALFGGIFLLRKRVQA
jgi:hypothetical protein